MEKACITCRHFTDGSISKHATYIEPVCTVHGGDDAMLVRQYICTLEGRLWQPMNAEAQQSAVTVADGSVPVLHT
jgi:hypothetical protein